MNELAARGRQGGFTLVEIGIVIIIVGLLLGGTVITLSTQMQVRNIKETEATMNAARDALLAFATAHGRLPCPAIAGGPLDTGVEHLTTGKCTVDNGFVPAMSLGLSPTDDRGYLLNTWGKRIRYAVTDSYSNAFTTAGGMRNAGISALSDEDIDNITVCNDISPCEDTTLAQYKLTKKAVFVLASSGKDDGMSDSQNAAAASQYFIYRPLSSNSDDMLIWVSPYTLFNRMLSAGAL